MSFYKRGRTFTQCRPQGVDESWKAQLEPSVVVRMTLPVLFDADACYNALRFLPQTFASLLPNCSHATKLLSRMMDPSMGLRET